MNLFKKTAFFDIWQTKRLKILHNDLRFGDFDQLDLTPFDLFLNFLTFFFALVLFQTTTKLTEYLNSKLDSQFNKELFHFFVFYHFPAFVDKSQNKLTKLSLNKGASQFRKGPSNFHATLQNICQILKLNADIQK